MHRIFVLLHLMFLSGWSSAADLPKALIIGDSISIGYTKGVMERLKDDISVSRPKANCGSTELGLAQLSNWIEGGPWKVIHFNWGLHDLCYRNPESKQQGNRDKVNGKQSVPLPQYETNLQTLVDRLKRTGAILIFATTTAVPEGEAGRFAGDERRYNEAALRVMTKNGVRINDLHALSITFPQELFVGPGNVHYTNAGSERLAEQVAASIRSAAK